jgi:hypothetical protein
MKRTIIFWILSLLITLGSAIYQRATGPTYPIKGKINLDGKDIKYSVARSHGGTTNHTVEIKTDDPAVEGFVIWKRYKTNDDWAKVPMLYKDGILSAELPNQPPAGKLQYQVTLKAGDKTFTLPEQGPNIIRFKGDVPTLVLIIHVLAMFTGMLFSNRAGIESLSKEPNLKKLALWTFGLLTVGGMILGPIVQKYAFGAFWTGWPFGTDLTDNKTAVVFITWLLAVISTYKFKNPKRWVLAAAIITLAVYLIPHSMLGSELDYSKLPQQ